MTALSRLGRMLRLRRAPRLFIDLPPTGLRDPLTAAQEARVREIAREQVVAITAEQHRRTLGGRS